MRNLLSAEAAPLLFIPGAFSYNSILSCKSAYSRGSPYSKQTVLFL
ncbi:MAG TPA: hypothetical protein VGD17_16845 [Chitinophagaceae bacterium]